jgi:hypothetical protein
MRTDGNHNDNLPRATALSQAFRCRSCSNVTPAGSIRIKDRLYGEGTPLLNLSDRADYDPVAEDELRCGTCNSDDLQIIS